MLHAINKYLAGKGHTVKVLLHQANHYKITEHYIYDGIDVFPSDPTFITNLFNSSDVVFTHLDYAEGTATRRRRFAAGVCSGAGAGVSSTAVST
jgi:hypothetical protein